MLEYGGVFYLFIVSTEVETVRLALIFYFAAVLALSSCDLGLCFAPVDCQERGQSHDHPTGGSGKFFSRQTTRLLLARATQ